MTADPSLPPTTEPVRVAARQLRWFRSAFRHWLEVQEDQLGCHFVLDEALLAEAFVAWLRAIEAQRPTRAADRAAYFEFAAGLMLRELVRLMPIRVTAPPTLAGKETAAGFWPEGHACTMFCLTVARAVMRQEFNEEAAIAAEVDDLRTWWSFRENAQEDVNTSVAFLELFLGRTPDWDTPTLFRPSTARVPELSPNEVKGPAALADAWRQTSRG